MSQLAARPAWTAAAVLCLAIGSAANTAAFTLVNGLLLRPLPFDNPSELLMVALRDPSTSGPRPLSLIEYRDLASRSTSAASLLARTYFPLSLSSDDGARIAQAELVSGNCFETLRLRPFRGRFFDATLPMFGVMGRLVPGVTLEDAGVRLTAAMADIGQERGTPALSVLADLQRNCRCRETTRGLRCRDGAYDAPGRFNAAVTIASQQDHAVFVRCQPPWRFACVNDRPCSRW